MRKEFILTKEEWQSYSKDEFEIWFSWLPTNMTCGEYALVSEYRRKIHNRLNAKRYRDKKRENDFRMKTRLEELDLYILTLEEDNTYLRQEVKRLNLLLLNYPHNS